MADDSSGRAATARRAVLVPPPWWRPVGLVLAFLFISVSAQAMLPLVGSAGGVSGRAVDAVPAVAQLLGPAQVPGAASFAQSDLAGPAAPCSPVPLGELLDAQARAAVRLDRPDGQVLLETLFVRPDPVFTDLALAVRCDEAVNHAGERFRVEAVEGGWTWSPIADGDWHAVQVRHEADSLLVLAEVSADGRVDLERLREHADRAVQQLESREPRAAGTILERAWLAFLLLTAVGACYVLAVLLRRWWSMATVFWMLAFLLPVSALCWAVVRSLGPWSQALTLLPAGLAGLLAMGRAMVGRALAAGSFSGEPTGPVPPVGDPRTGHVSAMAEDLAGLGFRPLAPAYVHEQRRCVGQVLAHEEAPVLAILQSFGGHGPHRDLSLVTPVVGTSATVATSSANDLPSALAGVEQTHPAATPQELWARHQQLLEDLRARGLRLASAVDEETVTARARVRWTAVRRAPLAAAASVMWWQLAGRRRRRWQPSRPRELAVRSLLRHAGAALVGGAD